MGVVARGSMGWPAAEAGRPGARSKSGRLGDEGSPLLSSFSEACLKMVSFVICKQETSSNIVKGA